MSRRWIARVGLVAAIAAILSGAGVAGLGPAGPTGPTVAAAGVPSYPSAAVAAPPDPRVGALFFRGLTVEHTCSASVLASVSHDLVITAAHCITGSGHGALFAPGYHHGQTPYRVWRVFRSYVDHRWQTTQEPRRDVAILQIAPLAIDGRVTHIQDVVSGYRLGFTPTSGARTVVSGYRLGFGGPQLTCATDVALTVGYPAFNCNGYFSGTSGSPFLVRNPASGITRTSGLIGGLHQGGCHDYTSYSSPFDQDTLTLMRRADVHGPGDQVVRAGTDGC